VVRVTPHDFQPVRNRWGGIDPFECKVCGLPWDYPIHHAPAWVRRAAEHRLPPKVAAR